MVPDMVMVSGDGVHSSPSKTPGGNGAGSDMLSLSEEEVAEEVTGTVVGAVIVERGV